MRLRPDRRRSPRTPANGLRLAYWDGAEGVVRPIRDVSLRGALVETPEWWWSVDTIVQAQLRAEVPLPVYVPGDAARNETVSISLTCKVVRLVPEGVCVAFIHHSRKELRVVKRFLTAARETQRMVEPSPREGSSARPANETVVPEAEPVAFPSPAMVSNTARSSETPFSSYEADATHLKVESSGTAAAHVWISVARNLVQRAWVVLVVISVLTISWLAYRTAAGPAGIPIGLQVLSRGEQLDIHWNNNATAIRRAAKGVMHISDGGVKEVIELDGKQLRNGGVAYSPTSKDVTVQLEISGVDGTRSSESVNSVAVPGILPKSSGTSEREPTR